MKVSLKTRLSLSYVTVALVCIALISILTQFLVDRHFREYVQQNREKRNKEIITSIGQQYLGDGTWDMSGLETIGIGALENSLIIKIKDNNGKMLWDATVHNNGMCQRIIEQMAHNMNSRYPGMKGSYEEIPYDIYVRFQHVGTVAIGSYGPFYLSENDLAFINSLNKILLGVGIFSLFFALLFGGIIARRLSSPISRVIKTAQAIARGCFSDRVSVVTNTREISQLTNTINGLAETLEKQEVLRKRLTGDVAHELRTPLATLQSHMEAMIDGIWKPDAGRLKSCHEEIIRINKMVGDLEKLAKFESENLVLDMSRFDVAELIKHILQNFESEYLHKRIAIEFDANEEWIFADRDKISQVIVNLLSNALKYTPEGGRVTVYITETQESIIIHVKDNGPGISEEDLPFIFERFYRSDQSRNRLTGGSGIGLTIAKAIVEAHNGSIDVQSHLHEGTEVTVSLPRSG